MDTLQNVIRRGLNIRVPSPLIYHISWTMFGQPLIHKDTRKWGDLVQAQSGNRPGEYPTSTGIRFGMKLANKLDPAPTGPKGGTYEFAAIPSTVGRALPASGPLGLNNNRDYRLEATFNHLSGGQLNKNSWVVGVHVRTGNVTNDSDVPALVRLATTLKVDTSATATTMRLNLPHSDITYDPQYSTQADREIDPNLFPILQSDQFPFTLGLEFSYRHGTAIATVEYNHNYFEVTATINNSGDLYSVLQNQQLTTAAVVLVLEEYSEQASVICESFKIYEF